MQLKSLQKKTLPTPPKSVRSLIGPSFILIGLGLGTGELILWPYLVANWGLGIIWGAALGITLQFFLNMEIERYALANGESVFVGFARLFKWLPYWFVLSTLLAWSWPGFSGAAAQVLSPILGMEDTRYIAILMLLIVGLTLTFGPVLYKTVESFQKILILVGIPIIVIIVVLVAELSDYAKLMEGLAGIGEGYYFIPKGLPLMAFLAAFAYSGAGGNLNLAQSFYIKEKGYGMGKYSGKITSLVTGKSEKVDIEGTTFEPNKKELAKFNKWWKMINIEHLLIFWGLGLLTILLLAVLSYATTYGHAGNAEGLNFVFTQAKVVSSEIGKFWGAALLVITSLMLFSTQLAVIDASGRIVSENIALIKRKKVKGSDIPKFYYATIWVLIVFGVLVFLVDLAQPAALIITGAVLNAFCMFVFSGLLVKLNTKLLPKQIHPSLVRKLIIYATFVFFGVFSALVFFDKVIK